MHSLTIEPELKEECGVFGIYDHPEAANLTYLGLYALQHRGQEGAGIVSSDGKRLYQERGVGLVNDLFNQTRLGRLKGSRAIGHVRYATHGDQNVKNVQPFMFNYSKGWLSIAHNGNLTNAVRLRRSLEDQGSIFQTTSDTEIINHLIARSKKNTLEERIVETLSRVKGAYSLLFLSESKMVAARDSYGFRPLALGEMDGKPVVASESTAFDLIGAKYIREIEPGEVLVISEEGMTSTLPFPKTETKKCIFEHIYFSRPDSFVFGENVYEMRTALGKQLALEQPADAEIVIPVPDSGVPAAIGYAQQAGLPFEMGIIRNHYVGRTFIEPEQSIRNFGVKIKLNPIKKLLEGKSIIVVDDSIVRGTTSRKIVQMLRANGAKKVHMRISSPPTTGPCFYGIDTPTKSELIASSNGIADICKYVGADSMGYISIEGLKKVVEGDKKPSYCSACFDDRYPLLPED